MGRDTSIAKLKEEIAAGRLVTIAGTGVSVAACGNQEVEGFKVATWTGLLRHGVKHLVDIGAANERVAGVLEMQVDSEETDLIITAAETISQRMRARSDGTFPGWLKDTVGKLKTRDRAVPDALAALPGVLATLNYDSLLEDATGRHAVTWLKADAVQDVLTRADPDAVLHLHGWFKEPESVVLGLGSYLAVKDHAHARAVLELFTIDRTLLFVGCGDTVLDPNFTRLIEWGREALRDVAPRHYLLCRASEVAAFQQKLAGAPWLQPLEYGADYGDLVPFLRGLVPPGGSAVTAKERVPSRASFDLAAYQQAMRRRYARLKLEELDPTTHDVRPLTLTGMFIEQSAREAAEFMPRLFELPKELQRRLREQGEMEGGDLDEELLEQHRRAYLDQSPRPILEIVRDPGFGRLVVLGDPGSGKSTLLQYLLLDWAEKPAPDPGDDPLPLLIELREYARLRHEGRVDGFLDYLHDGASVRWHLDRAQLDGWLKDNPSRILVDGLHEVFDPALRREVSTAIHRFADEYPLARIVVTSRIIGYQHQAWRDEGFRHFMLQELDAGQIAAFLDRWHGAAYEEAWGKTKRALLAGAIEQSTAIRQLAGNPLLLTMMAILNRTQDLPRDRAELYEQCARLLLHQWKVDVAFESDRELSKASLGYKDKRGLLLRVARAMQTSEQGLAGNLIDEDALERTLAGGLEGVPNLRPDRAARALIEQLRGRNFMLCSVGGRLYAFVHRTFLEYFCAVEIRERFQTEQSLSLEQLKTEIFGHWVDETWHEVLSLLAGMLAPRFVGEILDWLLERPDPADACPHVFLAARCIGEVRRREELGDVERRVLARTRALTRFDLRHPYDGSATEARSAVIDIRTRAVQMVATVWRETADTRAWLEARAHSDEDWVVRQIAVQELARGWKDDPETLPILKARAQSDDNEWVRQTAVQELACGWKDDPETLPILKARAQSDGSVLVRQIAIKELAHGWKDDPETLPILKALAQSDENWTVRQSAVQELARGWNEDPETLSILKALAQSDEYSVVRQSAVQELARGWNDDPETLSILKVLAQFDDNEWVRQSAVQELARTWKDHSETFSILKVLAQSDESAPVRQSAIGALARGWKDNPETLPILKVCTQFDEDFRVREMAVQEMARRWKDDPETLLWLRELAAKDSSDDVQATVRELIAQEWWRDLTCRTILRTDSRTSFSADASARASAASIAAHIKVARFWTRKLCGELDDGPEPSMLPGYPALRVAQFRLRDIGPFEDTGRVELNRELNVILGDNASGKSTILRSLALAAVGISAANEVELNASSYLRKGAGKGIIEVIFEVVPDPGAPEESSGYFMVGLEIAADSTRFAALAEEDRTLDDSSGLKFPVRDAGENLGSCRTALTTPFGFISAYGVVRTFSTSRSGIQSELPRRENEWVASLFDTGAPLVNPEVLAKLLRGDTSNIENAPTPILSPKVTSSLIRSFKHIMPEVQSWAGGDGHDLRLAGVDLRLAELSDGYRSLLALMAHLVRCALKVKNWTGNPTRIDGIVLVDEMDLHLHPSWQRRVLQDFRHAWPGLQIIASTHSPLIVGTLKREHIFVVRRTDGGGVTIDKPAADAQGLGVAGVLTDIFKLALTIDEPTLTKITERLTLHARRGMWTKEDRDRYADLSEELARLGFNRELIDPYFAEFAAAIARRYGGRLGSLSAEERRDLDAYADELLSNLE